MITLHVAVRSPKRGETKVENALTFEGHRVVAVLPHTMKPDERELVSRFLRAGSDA